MNANLEMLDPRGHFSSKLIKRIKKLYNLSGKKIIIYDNCKMSSEYSSHANLTDSLSSGLKNNYNLAEVILTGSNLLNNYSSDYLNQEAERLANIKADAVIIGLNDAGVTYASCLLAKRLTEKGLNALLLCTMEGAKLARSLVSVTVPGLPVVEIPLSYKDEHSTEGELISRIAEGLTQDVQVLNNDEMEKEVWPEIKAEDNFGHYMQSLIEALEKKHIGDGLPVIPPDKELVEKMIATVDYLPDQIVWPSMGPKLANLTVLKAAVNAVMAGCKPEYFSTVLAALKAMASPEYLLSWAGVTTHPAGNAVLVSGPLAKKIGMWSGPGCLGPGFPANATIGRAVNLSVINGLGAKPGYNDLSLIGSPAEFTYCFAENEDESPWPALHQEYGEDVTTVTVAKVEGPHNVLDHLSKTPEGLLDTMASTMTTLGANTSYIPSNLIVIFNPEHAWMLANHNWSKEDVQRYLFEKARNKRDQLSGRGIIPKWPHWFSDPVPIVEDYKNIIVTVAGGWGPQSMVALPWGWSRAVTKVICDVSGNPI